MIPRLFKRHTDRRLVLEFNPYQILAASLTCPRAGAVVMDAAAEFDRDDDDGYRRWVEAHSDRGSAWTSTICSFVPRRGLMQRESLPGRKLVTTQYLTDLVEKQQEHRSHSATPFRIGANAWTLRAVSAVDGAPIVSDGSSRPALICGMPTDEVRQLQQRLVDQRLMPDRLEPGLLSLFGVIRAVTERRGEMRAVVVIVIHPSATAVYILGKEGVHTPSPVLYGFNSVLEVAKKELATKDDAETIARLQHPERDVLNLASKLVRSIGRNLKPVVDSYEMTTGQPVDEVFCAYAPPAFQWLAEPLVRATGRTLMEIDSKEWLRTTGLQVGAGVSVFGSHWLGALGTAATLVRAAGSKTDKGRGEDADDHGPWHVDCRLTGELADHRLAGRRFLTGTIAAALVIFVTAITAWQLHARAAIRADILYWEKQMAANRKLFDELSAANMELKRQSKRLADAHDLMAVPYQFTDLVIDLGRTMPAHMRLERIETQDDRVAISGTLLQPAEVASETLGRYMDSLRRDAAIGPRFSTIAITSLQRKTDNSEAVAFEITLRLNRSLP
jgi:hypothetical protein